MSIAVVSNAPTPSFIKAKSKVFRKFLTSLEAVRMAKLTNTEDWGKSFRSQVSIKTDNKFKVLNSRGKISLNVNKFQYRNYM